MQGTNPGSQTFMHIGHSKKISSTARFLFPALPTLLLFCAATEPRPFICNNLGGVTRCNWHTRAGREFVCLSIKAVRVR